MTSSPKRSWWRFSIRTMLIVVTLLCAMLGLWIRGAIRQRDSVAALMASKASILTHYSYEVDAAYVWLEVDSPRPEWLWELLGNDFLATIVAVDIFDAKDDQLLPLKEMPGLRALDLSMCYELTDAGMAHLKDLTGLHKLNIYGAQMTGEGLAALEPLTNLQDVHLLDCDQITDSGITHLGKITSLRKLGISGSTQVTDSGMAKLRSLTNLRILSLDFSGSTTDAILEQLQSLPKLQELRLDYGEKPGGTGLQYLSGFGALESVTLFGNGLTEESFSNLPVLPRLKSLSLIHSGGLTNDSLMNLEKVPNLEELWLSGPKQLDDDAMVHLQRLPRLKSLSISGDSFNLTDTGLESIGRLPSLRAIRLYACAKITDRGLMNLAELSNLAELVIEVDQFNQLSPKALADLGRKLPNCRIDYRKNVHGF